MTNGAFDEAQMEPKAKVFICYARADLAFADRVVMALKERGFEGLIDRSDILPSEPWLPRIEELIAQADTVLFVISPEAVSSKVCKDEVAFAGRLNKRFVPVLWRRVSAKEVPKELSDPQWIFFDDPAPFDERIDELAKALETDIQWIRKHTEFGEAARRWAVAGRPGPRGLLLRSPMLEDAEGWITSRPPSAPAPTGETEAFIYESRRGANRRRNILIGSLFAGLVVAVMLTELVYWQSGIAMEQSNVAEGRRISEIAGQATAESLRSNLDTALRLGVHAARLALAVDRNGAEIAGARTALAVAIWQSAWRLSFKDVVGVRSAAFSPDGSRIVTASGNHTARVWETATGKEIGVLRGHEGDVYSAAFSPDGKRIVTASGDHTARIWETATGREIAVFRRHDGDVYSAAFSPDGKRIVTVSQGVAYIWDTATGNEIAVLRQRVGGLRSAVYSPDGKHIVTASAGFVGITSSPDTTARIWNAETGKEIAVLRGHDDLVTSAAFSPDGSHIVTASEDKTAHIWDAATGKVIAVLSGHEGAVYSAVFSPDGKRIVTASGDHTARIWDAATGKVIAVLSGHENKVTSAAFSADGKRIVTASMDNTARIWDAAITGRRLRSYAGMRAW